MTRKKTKLSVVPGVTEERVNVGALPIVDAKTQSRMASCPGCKRPMRTLGGLNNPAREFYCATCDVSILYCDGRVHKGGKDSA